MSHDEVKDIIGFLKRGVGGLYSDMANALMSIPNTSMDDVAYAIKNGLGLDNLKDVASTIVCVRLGPYMYLDLQLHINARDCLGCLNNLLSVDHTYTYA